MKKAAKIVEDSKNDYPNTGWIENRPELNIKNSIVDVEKLTPQQIIALKAGDKNPLTGKILKVGTEIGDIHPTTGKLILGKIEETIITDPLVGMAKPSLKKEITSLYEINPKHVVTELTKASDLPANHLELFKNSIPYVKADGSIVRYAKDSNGVYHQFYSSSPTPTTTGISPAMNRQTYTFHWAGTPNKIENVPIEIRGALKWETREMENEIIGDKELFAVEYCIDYENTFGEIVYGGYRFWFRGRYIGDINDYVYITAMYLKNTAEFFSKRRIDETYEVPKTKEKFIERSQDDNDEIWDKHRFFFEYENTRGFSTACFSNLDNLIICWYLDLEWIVNEEGRLQFKDYPSELQVVEIPISAIKEVADKFEARIQGIIEENKMKLETNQS